MKYSTITCVECGTQKEISIHEQVRNSTKFCSLRCSAICNGRKRSNALKTPNCKCAYCEKPIYKSPTKLAQSKHNLHFCCREHKDLAQRLNGITELHPPHYGNGKDHSRYRALAKQNFEQKCARCNYNLHPEILQVHHKDRNRENNTIENLEYLCPNCHETEHFLAKDGRWKSQNRK